MAQSKNQRTSKKIVTSYDKKEKPKKQILLFPCSVNELVDGKVNGFEFIKTVRKFGKDYFECKRG